MKAIRLAFKTHLSPRGIRLLNYVVRGPRDVEEPTWVTDVAKKGEASAD